MGDELGVRVDADEHVLIAQAHRVPFLLAQTRLLLPAERPDFIDLHLRAREVPHPLGHDPLAVLTHPDGEPHDRIPMHPGQALNAADADAFDQGGHHGKLLLGLEDVHRGLLFLCRRPYHEGGCETRLDGSGC